MDCDCRFQSIMGATLTRRSKSFMSKCFWRCVSVVRDYTDRHCRHLNARPSLDRFTLRSPEDAALQNRSVSDRPAHAHPKSVDVAPTPSVSGPTTVRPVRKIEPP